MTFKIRKAKASESKLLSNLALRLKAYWGYSQKFIDTCWQEITYSKEYIQNNYVFVAEDENNILGFYSLKLFINTADIELDALFIEPSCIKQAYGRKLIEHAKFISRKLKKQNMVIFGNPNTKDFYLKVGAKFVGKRKSDTFSNRYLPIFTLSLAEVDN
ncbi:GNAT family N-acetyltransferase [Myxosarcina sp. GI1]|uniref:GNAT family N-acetyltransferase n=1 Tax=Myxosarcina sp. GI1 TaxID=1541065 RepID=UPI00055B184D|nr:GNAT family N-acetyltransferase [Myxosarcina sp. GI1]